jgi:hypothetical protein
MILPDGSGFFIAEVGEPRSDPVCWNPFNKVVQDHRDGTINHVRTEVERRARSLPVPWSPALGEIECSQPPTW